jgi:DNA-binding response OmpR family regulator
MNKKVLICDDELYIQEAVQYVVRQAGYTPLLAQDGEESLAVAQKESPDLIILDIMMPKRNGFEVCELLKNDSKTKNIYIIMLTARGYDTDSLKSEKCGADELITKPFSPRKLQRRLKEVLENNKYT